MNDRPSTNCDNYLRNCVYQPPFIKYPNGHKTKNSQRMDPFWNCSRITKKPMKLTFPMSISIVRSSICKGMYFFIFHICCEGCEHTSNRHWLIFTAYSVWFFVSAFIIYTWEIFKFLSFLFDSICSVNKIIQERSNQSACTFLYLAPPPNINSSNWESASRQYLELLTELTVDLPPTILVHGVHTVTSTTL